MLSRLIELILRTSANLATGHIPIKAKQRQPSPSKPAPDIPPDAWLIGHEVPFGDSGTTSGDPIGLTLGDLRRSCHITGAPGSGKTTTILSLIDFLLGDEDDE